MTVITIIIEIKYYHFCGHNFQCIFASLFDALLQTFICLFAPAFNGLIDMINGYICISIGGASKMDVGLTVCIVDIQSGFTIIGKSFEQFAAIINRLSCSSSTRCDVIINGLLCPFHGVFNFTVLTTSTLTIITIGIGFCLSCVSLQHTQIAVTKRIIKMDPGDTRIGVVALLPATTITITRFENIFEGLLVTPLTKVITTVVPGIGFEYGLETIHQHYDDIIARNDNDIRDLLSLRVIGIYQNRIIFDISENENENENQIRFRIFTCFNEYVLQEYLYYNEINNEYTFCCNCNENCCKQ